LRGAAGLPDDLRVVALDAGVEGASVTDRDLATLDPAPLDRPCESDLAYILYTSGSTGVPKGVMLTHRNALAFAEWVVWRFGVTSHDRLVSHAPFHFDLSVFDLYGAVLSAACVRLLDAGERTFGKEMTDVVRADGLSVWYSVPSALTLLCDAASPADVETLRVVLFAGEVFPTKHLRRLRELLPRATLANLYGPTETNVCTYYVVPDRLESDDPIPIGRACENQDVFALDEDRRPVGVGGTGELWVRGPTVMKGYFGDAEKTRATLMQNPLHERFADPVYRTGDLVSPLADGDLAFLGRRDHQIKVRGYRVELGEIEAAMMSHPTVRECAVVAVPDERSGHRLVAFVVVEGELAERALRHHCAERIPKYMMPSELRVDASLPRTSTGKIDRQQLVERVQALLTSNE
jgi:amino acid adenylation domain-containing protein